MVGMRDVAKKAGVSLSTVSLVVNGNGYVSDDMRERVRKAMQALNYVPNELARNLYHDCTNLRHRAHHPPPVLCDVYRTSAACARRARITHYAVLYRR